MSPAADADAALVVLMSPSGPPSPSPPPESLFALGSRLLEVANWRDMQAELRSLPAGWSREGDPARICVVEPDTSLPGGVLGFDPANAAALIERGEADAWEALERAGWLAPAQRATGQRGPWPVRRADAPRTRPTRSRAVRALVSPGGFV